MIHPKQSHYWTFEEIVGLDRARDMSDLRDIALIILQRMKTRDKDIIQICGPMTTGGTEHLETNMSIFKRAVCAAIDRDLHVFNQTPFQDAMVRIVQWKPGMDYAKVILEVFYRGIFESGHVSKALFLPGWEKSTGASWEWELLTKLGVPIEMYPIEWIQPPVA